MAHPSIGSAPKVCTVLYLFLLANQSCAPRYYNYNSHYAEPSALVELGGSIGGINCLTDLGGGIGPGKKFIKDINWNNTQVCSSIYASCTVNDVVGLRFETTFGKVKAYDSVLTNRKEESHGRYYRNLNFQSNIAEYAIVSEFHPLMLKNYTDNGLPRFSPYLLAGIARFNFNPQAYFKGQWVYLQPLHLEGQGFAEYKDRKEYRLSATSYPMGLGLRCELGSLFYARLEGIYRITSTDYLDDVSKEQYINPGVFSRYLSPAQAAMAEQLYSRSHELGGSTPNENSSRGYSTNNDSYFSFSLKIGLVINRGRTGR